MPSIKQNQQLKVTYRAVADLIPYVKNPRTHSAEQITQLANSIKEFGWTNPVLVDGASGLIAGHGRVLAAKALGLAEVPTIELSGMSEAQRRAYIIADNQLAVNAGWDRDLLRLELGSLAELNFDLSLTGLPEFELQALNFERGENDVDAEWQGMPEFEQPDQRAFRSVVIHFHDQDAVDGFSKLLRQQLTPKTKFLWFPKVEKKTHVDKAYVVDAEIPDLHSVKGAA